MFSVLGCEGEGGGKIGCICSWLEILDVFLNWFFIAAFDGSEVIPRSLKRLHQVITNAMN